MFSHQSTTSCTHPLSFTSTALGIGTSRHGLDATGEGNVSLAGCRRHGEVREGPSPVVRARNDGVARSVEREVDSPVFARPGGEQQDVLGTSGDAALEQHVPQPSGGNATVICDGTTSADACLEADPTVALERRDSRVGNGG